MRVILLVMIITVSILHASDDVGEVSEVQTLSTKLTFMIQQAMQKKYYWRQQNVASDLRLEDSCYF